MKIDWYKCKGSIWCELDKIDTNHPYLNELEGVYIIWYGSGEKTVLRIGHGMIKHELQANKKDLAVMAFKFFGVFVTWAEVPKSKRKNVVAYLAKTLKPRISSALMIDPPQEVNLPW